MSCTKWVYPLTVVFFGNNPLVKLQLLFSHILKIHFLLCVGLHCCYYVVNLRLSSLHSVVLVDCIHHFHVVYFPGIFVFIFHAVGHCFLSFSLALFLWSGAMLTDLESCTPRCTQCTHCCEIMKKWRL